MKKQLLLLLSLSTLFAKGQDYKYVRVEPNLGYYIGVHALDDDDIPFTDPFNPNTINWAFYPSKVGIVYNVAEPFVLESNVSYIKLKRDSAHKYVSPYNCFGFEINLQNHFCLYRKTEYDQFGISSNKRAKLLSIYPTMGISANLKSVLNEDLFFNANLGGGTNWWVIPNKLAINAQALAQIGLAGTVFQGNANQVRYSLGIIYKR